MVGGTANRAGKSCLQFPGQNACLCIQKQAVGPEVGLLCFIADGGELGIFGLGLLELCGQFGPLVMLVFQVGQCVLPGHGILHSPVRLCLFHRDGLEVG